MKRLSQLFTTNGKLSHLKTGGWLLLLLFIGLCIYSAIVHRDINDMLDRIAWLLAGLWAFRVANYITEKVKENDKASTNS